LYYTGIQTLVSTPADMAARAQMLRRHNYVMRGVRPPAHAIPPAPVITSAQTKSSTERLGTRIYWQGSAGARNYSVQRATAAAGPWTTVCKQCATDLDDGYLDESSEEKGSWYRVIPYNLGGRPGPASNPIKASTG
jgi:hypothetical protein